MASTLVLGPQKYEEQGRNPLSPDSPGLSLQEEAWRGLSLLLAFAADTPGSLQWVLPKALSGSVARPAPWGL